MITRVSALVVLLLVAAVPARAIDVQRVVSPGGIEAWLVEDHRNPIISLELAFRGGAALDPAGKEGLANLLSSVLDEGAGDLDSQAFRTELEDLAIKLSFDAGRDSFTGQLKTLTVNRDRAFELLRLALNEPRFDDEPVAEIARKLDVEALVEGSVLRAGDRVRVTAQLVDARDGHLLWAQSYAHGIESCWRRRWFGRCPTPASAVPLGPPP